jgi:hypothetical protein
LQCSGERARDKMVGIIAPMRANKFVIGGILWCIRDQFNHRGTEDTGKN